MSASDSAEAFSRFQSTSRFALLDGLRCLCILAVIWHHGPLSTALPWAAMPLAGRGFLGVDFFFVLSGFLITTLLLREESARGFFSLRGFYWRRILRIVPVYFFVVTAAVLWFVILKGNWQWLPQVPFYYLFLTNFLHDRVPLLAPTWSLSVEEQYYLVWPLVLQLVPRRRVLAVLAGLIAANVLGIMGAFEVLGLHAFDLGPLRIALPNATYAPILMGSALALLLQNPRGFAVLSRLFGWREAAPVLFAVILVLMVILPDDLRGLPNLALHLAMSAALASLVLREDQWLAPVLAWRPVARVGEISYGIYLYHLIGLQLATMMLEPMGWTSLWGKLVLYTLISILLAEVSYRTLEAWARGLRSPKPAPPAMPASRPRVSAPPQDGGDGRTT